MKNNPQTVSQYSPSSATSLECSKIRNYLHTISQLQKNNSKLQEQIQYCKKVEEWLTSVKAVVNKKAVDKGLKSLMNASSKINLLEKQAIFSVGKDARNGKQGTGGKGNGKGCSVSGHLNYILRQRQKTRDQKEVLLSKREELYKKIQETLVKQEPYMHEKIMKKIKRQVKRQTKLQAIKQLQKYCKSKQNWLGQAQSKINSTVDQKILEQKLSQNLSKMKQLLTKKILTNTYISEMLSNKQNIDKNAQRLKKLSSQTINTLKQQIKKSKEIDYNEQLNTLQQFKNKREKLESNEFDDIFIKELKQNMGDAMRVLAMPLGSQTMEGLLQECQKLEVKINGLVGKKY